MGVVGGQLGYRLLRAINPTGDEGVDASAYAGGSKLDVLLGGEFWSELAGRTVIDFGCGLGGESIEMAKRGAGRVIGIDMRESVLEQARHHADREGVGDKCSFVTRTDERADIILSVDAFEHFEDPGAVLRVMRNLLKDDGCVWVSFGPTWYHPYGGHLFSVFPWAHLVFTEGALIRWRSDFKTDGATKFSEVAGGLNQMTIRRFCRLVRESPFEFGAFEAVPIRKIGLFSNPLTREFLTAVVKCKLVAAAP
jgi:SAM-dependent methyltransferase